MSYALPQRRLVSQEDAAMVARPDVPRSRFLGSWSRKTTFDAGLLIPFLCDEIVPGDHMKYDVTAMVRMATPLFPLMDSQRVDTHFFFVPARILWDNWQRFMGEQDTPSSTINYTIPQLVSPNGGFAVDSIYDQFGLPVAGQLDPAGNISVNCLPLRAYKLIYHEWFRDQNVVSENVTIGTGNGPDTVAQYGIYRRAKSHDYFTSCLPWPQKFTSPAVPLVGNAPVYGVALPAANSAIAGTPANSEQYDGTLATGWSGHIAGNNLFFATTGAGTNQSPQIYARLSDATGIDLNQFRQAMLIQQMLERDARGGTRYTEVIFNQFGVRVPDYRLQRPEFIGGGSSPLQVTPVAQTAPGTGTSVGNLGAAGTSVGSHRASFAAQEHGYVIGLISVKSELSYQQGVHRMFSRLTRYDFYTPPLAGLGEQAVLRKELFAKGIANDDNTVFGYQERWHEYRTRYSEVTGKFRGGVPGTLDAWHLSQRFGTPPVLGTTFVGDNPPMDRVLAAGALAANQQYLADILIRREAVRPLPMFGTPSGFGRF